MTTYTAVPSRPIRVMARPSVTSGAMRRRVTGRESLSNSQGAVAAVPTSQLYYWTRAWQVNEQIAADEIARGDTVSFDTTADAIRWLLSDDVD